MFDPIARSADWIAAEYNNQNAPGGFYSVSGEASAASVIASTATGVWSAPSTWAGSQVPTQCNPVHVVSGTTVTMVAVGTCTIAATDRRYRMKVAVPAQGIVSPPNPRAELGSA